MGVHAQPLRGRAARIVFMLQLGYFKAKRAFFDLSTDSIPADDVTWLTAHYFPGAVADPAPVTAYERYAQRREVMRRDRQCRFPGCSNVTFAAVHHLRPWGKGGPTDLDNLVLLCTHHHGVVHRNGWSMTGNPNEELRVENPSGRVVMSRPSPLWARVTAGRGSPRSG